MPLPKDQIKSILEAAILSASEPVSLERLSQLFAEDEALTAMQLREILQEMAEDCGVRGVELKEVASGFRYQVKTEVIPWLMRWIEERPARYSRALLETLALIVYRQPITRAEIEEVRGVAVSSTIMRTLLEREWVKVLGHRDLPGRPALYGTTKQFLDYFNLKSLTELPPLADIATELQNLEGAEQMLLELKAQTVPVVAEPDVITV
ncbi:MAG TPA: SMC-Scp complex subunit ScpB [Gammaproteobacteria bacterium]|nr:SMC-Scp complex subunit ScpB [Gammaproteobacteria bacterium]